MFQSHCNQKKIKVSIIQKQIELSKEFPVLFLIQNQYLETDKSKNLAIFHFNEISVVDDFQEF